MKPHSAARVFVDASAAAVLLLTLALLAGPAAGVIGCTHDSDCAYLNTGCSYFYCDVEICQQVSLGGGRFDAPMPPKTHNLFNVRYLACWLCTQLNIYI